MKHQIASCSTYTIVLSLSMQAHISILVGTITYPTQSLRRKKARVKRSNKKTNR
jgi:hypothetical protein